MLLVSICCDNFSSQEENQSLVADKDALSIMLSKADRKKSQINERLQESEKERADWELRAGRLEQLVEEARRMLDGQNEVCTVHMYVCILTRSRTVKLVCPV